MAQCVEQRPARLDCQRPIRAIDPQAYIHLDALPRASRPTAR
jgi:hypothetical protein